MAAHVNVVGLLLDAGLVVTIVWLAVRALAEVKLFRSVVLFIAFGLLTALAWVRLAAPDIALAEAAIGAGMTGALLLDAAGHLRGRDMPFPSMAALAPQRSAVSARDPRRWSTRIAAATLCAVMFAIIVRGVLAIPDTERGMAPVIDANVAASGVKNAVTAVLLNFRGYDTLLEIAVLMLATIGVHSLRRQTSGIWAPLAPPPTRCSRP